MGNHAVAESEDENDDKEELFDLNDSPESCSSKLVVDPRVESV